MTKIHGAALVAATLVFAATPLHAQIVRQIGDAKADLFGLAALDDAGTEVWVVSSEDTFGSNSAHAYQIVRYDAVSGAGTAVTSFPGGLGTVFYGLSVSDDGQWVAFAATADLTGQNHDRSAELFVMMRDGTQLAQLTNDPAPNAGSVYEVALAGSANRVAFIAQTDPLGTNPDHHYQVFVIDRTGSNLRQLTQASGGEIEYVGISDDGQRLAFAHEGDLTGGNPDLSWEIFAVLADGTGLAQRTNSTVDDFGELSLSGNGLRIAYQSAVGGIFATNWLSGPSTLLEKGFHPSINDTGGFVFFANASGQIMRIRADGTSLVPLTTLAGAAYPVVSGGLGRVAFRASGTAPGGSNPDGSDELLAMDNAGANLRQLTDNLAPIVIRADLSADGAHVVFQTEQGADRKIFLAGADGSGPVLLTDSDLALEPAISGDGSRIVFHDLAKHEVFRIQADGSGLTQLTTCVGNQFSRGAQISADGSLIAFHSNCNFTGQNSDGSGELFSFDALGTIRQLSSGPGPGGGFYSYFPRLDATGTWVVFSSLDNVFGANPARNLQAYRIRSDGTGFQAITNDPTYLAAYPDVSADGSRISYLGQADPLGTNLDHNYEVFLYEPGTNTTRQLTQTTTGDHYGVRISGNGEWVYFVSDADYFEDDPDEYYDAFRVHVDTGVVERVGGLNTGRMELAHLAFPLGAEVDNSGARAVHMAKGDMAEGNPDQHWEVWLTDRATPASIRPSRLSPTVVDWDVETGPVRYDVIRGNVANLQPGPGSTVDLGPVACLENDSPDSDTGGSPDLVDPAAGQAFFYAYAGSQGLAAPPGSYGRSTAGAERVPGAGACPP